MNCEQNCALGQILLHYDTGQSMCHRSATLWVVVDESQNFRGTPCAAVPPCRGTQHAQGSWRALVLTFNGRAIFYGARQRIWHWEQYWCCLTEL